MLVRAPYVLFFILTISWLRHNAAIPLTSLSAVNQDVPKGENANLQTNWNYAAPLFRMKRYAESMGVASDNKYNAGTTPNLNGQQKNRIMINNRNVNLNILSHHRRYKQPDHGSMSVVTTQNLENVIKEEQSTNCTSGKKKNQRYSSSFVGNTTSHDLSVDKEFDEVIGNNSKAKRTSSVHMDEDITLCWIETTTIKENKTVRPPKRLVIREYTISFENSATIPDRYLECQKLEDEVTASDPEISKTALFEVIDEDTKVSRIVNFTTVSHVGDVTVWQHKRVKCGVGPVVSKNIIEWNDGSENPKKRVEIKVSPKTHKLTAAKTDEEEPCTEEIEEASTDSDVSNFTESCENATNGICEVTTESEESSTRYPETIATEGTTELPSSESSSESESYEKELSTSTDITESPTSSREEVFARLTTTTTVTKTSTTTIFEKTDESVLLEKEIKVCEVDSSDPACKMPKDQTRSFEKLSTELPTTTEAVKKSETSLEILMNTKTTSNVPALDSSTVAITEKEISSEEKPLAVTESVPNSSEEGASSMIPDLVTEKTTTPFPSRTDISMESSESRTPEDISEESATTVHSVASYTDRNASTTSEMMTASSSVTDSEKEDGTSESTEVFGAGISTTTSAEEPDSISKEASGDGSVVEESTEDHGATVPAESSTSVESEETNGVSSSDVSTTSSIEQAITTSVVPLGFIEFTKESRKPGKILDKLSEPSTISIDSTTVESESSSMSKGASSEAGEETVMLPNEETTIGLKGTTGVKSVTISTTSTALPRTKATTSSPTASSEIDYSCENSEDCAYVSSSEACDEFGNCARTTTRFCASGECSEEEVTESSTMPDTTTPSMTGIQTHAESHSFATQIVTESQHTTAASTTTTTLTSRESENSSTAINNVPTTVETRRSTPLSSITTIAPRHRLTLKIKVLLEHVNENEEKQNLVEVEKHLSLNEDPEHHGHPDLLEKLKALNNSVNMETVSALLNCTSLRKTVDTNLINRQSNDTVDANLEELKFIYPEDSISRAQPSSGHAKYEDSQYQESDRFDHELESPKRRGRRSLDVNETGNLGRLEIARQNLSNSNDSLMSDLDDSSAILGQQNNLTSDLDGSSSILGQQNNLTEEIIQLSTTTNNPEEETSDAVYTISERNEGMIEGKNNSEVLPTAENTNNEMKLKAVQQSLPGIQEDVLMGLQHMSQLATNLTSVDDTEETAKTDLLKIIANPKDDRIRSRRRRAATEEVGRWSNERIRKAPMGGNLRSLTEFTLYKVVP